MNNVNNTVQAPFSIKEVFRFGWHATIDNFGLLATSVVVALVVSTIFDLLGNAAEDARTGLFLAIVINAVSISVGILMELGLANVSLILARGEKASWYSFAEPAHSFFAYIVASLLFFGAVVGGVMLLIVPGIIFALMFSLFSCALVDGALGPIEALKESVRLTRGVKWQIFLFFIAAIGVNILGFLALFVGLVVTIPMTTIATARVYYALRRRLEPVVIASEDGIESGTLVPASSLHNSEQTNSSI